mmetsp:Transcript_34394/g.109500  ORF Transcript_34394/g.109500 Transcript_34394/m.109500 type:complete len:212 (-) Transcript_34394:1435-2070(-)
MRQVVARARDAAARHAVGAADGRAAAADRGARTLRAGAGRRRCGAVRSPNGAWRARREPEHPLLVCDHWLPGAASRARGQCRAGRRRGAAWSGVGPVAHHHRRVPRARHRLGPALPARPQVARVAPTLEDCAHVSNPARQAAPRLLCRHHRSIGRRAAPCRRRPALPARRALPGGDHRRARAVAARPTAVHRHQARKGQPGGSGAGQAGAS